MNAPGCSSVSGCPEDFDIGQLIDTIIRMKEVSERIENKLMKLGEKYES